MKMENKKKEGKNKILKTAGKTLGIVSMSLLLNGIVIPPVTAQTEGAFDTEIYNNMVNEADNADADYIEDIKMRIRTEGIDGIKEDINRSGFFLDLINAS